MEEQRAREEAAAAAAELAAAVHAQALENAELTARLAAVSAKAEPPTSAPSSARAVPMKAVPMEGPRYASAAARRSGRAT